LEELSKLVDTVTIINQGKVIFQGKKTEFLSLGSKIITSSALSLGINGSKSLAKSQ